jgi:hypothetical protein
LNLRDGQDSHFDKARWWIEYRLQGRRVHKAVPEARTKAQAERAEISERGANYNRRYNKGSDIGLTTYYEDFYLPWLKGKKRSRLIDAQSRIKKLKAFFGNQPLREITRRDVKRFQASLRGKETRRRTSRKGATVNRYIYLLSAIFSRAAVDGIVEFNPKRERYLSN